MTSLRRQLGALTVTAFVWLLALGLPVVPVLQAPVVQDPIYRPTLVSVLQLLLSPFLMGISLQATWLTLPVFLGLIVATFIATRFLKRRILQRV